MIKYGELLRRQVLVNDGIRTHNIEIEMDVMWIKVLLPGFYQLVISEGHRGISLLLSLKQRPLPSLNFLNFYELLFNFIFELGK